MIQNVRPDRPTAVWTGETAALASRCPERSVQSPGTVIDEQGDEGMQHFGDIAFGERSLEHQRRRGSYDSYREMREYPAASGLGPDEIEFLRERDSFYLSSVGEQGWPYVQHRGGPVE